MKEQRKLPQLMNFGCCGAVVQLQYRFSWQVLLFDLPTLIVCFS